MTNPIRAQALEQIPSLNHGFFGKAFGLSKDDDEERNTGFLKIAKELKTSSQSIVTLKQMHSADVLIIKEPLEGELPKADALITTVPGLYVGVYTADCVPILLSSVKGDMVAAIHAGWRGALAGIIENTIFAMRSISATNLIAALGPCIWQDSYEVSQSFYESFNAKEFFKPSRRAFHWYFDLPGYVSARLKKAGVMHVVPSP
ncbi:MAG TPA: polyphenol oxidase family protein, partial [Myxococcota bacterium]|nr:polyphenol oxidase family protein [Myxococcota bacterium]